MQLFQSLSTGTARCDIINVVKGKWPSNGIGQICVQTSWFQALPDLTVPLLLVQLPLTLLKYFRKKKQASGKINNVIGRYPIALNN